MYVNHFKIAEKTWKPYPTIPNQSGLSHLQHNVYGCYMHLIHIQLYLNVMSIFYKGWTMGINDSFFHPKYNRFVFIIQLIDWKHLGKVISASLITPKCATYMPKCKISAKQSMGCENIEVRAHYTEKEKSDFKYNLWGVG